MSDRLQGRKILCADDEERITRLIKTILEKEGAAVEVVHDGAKALRMATMDAHDVLIMDLNMPGMNGLEAIRSIRILMPGKPILVLTGYSTDENIQAAREAGATECMVKPVKMQVLIEIVHALCVNADSEE